MKELFTLDFQDYPADAPVFERTSVKAIIRRGDSLCFQRDGKGAFKIPGGGQERGETLMDTLCREIREETGLLVIRRTVRPLGRVTEIRRDRRYEGQIYMAHSLYYACAVEDRLVSTCMTPSERARGMQPVWESLRAAYDSNRAREGEIWLERDTRVMGLLLSGEISCDPWP